ncbi:hypothetical protein ACSTIX_23960, partial [Vibrio parahaemolyticus]
APRPVSRTPLAAQTLSFGEKWPLPAIDDAVLARIAVQPAPAGRLADLLFRRPLLWLRLWLANGIERRYRLIPGIAAEGFVL